MPATAISIGNETSAWEYIKEALEGKYDNEVVELDFENWHLFHINILLLLDAHVDMPFEKENHRHNVYPLYYLLKISLHLNKILLQIIIQI